MWNKVKWAIRIVLILILAVFLHYVLPQRDIVKVTGVEQISSFQTNWPLFFAQADQGTAVQDTFSLRLIQTVRKRTWLFGMIDRGEQTMVYRNQDTGWIWPPFFKFDSSDLQAEAARLAQAQPPGWAVMTHYGWRVIFITVFPNAISLRPIESPDVVLIPWVNIIILSLLAFAIFMVRRMWLQFRERTIDPAVDDVGDAWDAADARADAARDRARGMFGRFGGWLGSWRKKPPRR